LPNLPPTPPRVPQGGALSQQANDGYIQVNQRCRLANNSAAQSGGAILAGSTTSVSLIASAFESNVSPGIGGAVTCNHCGAMVLSNCSFTDNAAPAGGALAIFGALSGNVIEDCSFRGNDATTAAGALVVPLLPPPEQGRSGRALLQVRGSFLGFPPLAPAPHSSAWHAPPAPLARPPALPLLWRADTPLPPLLPAVHCPGPLAQLRLCRR